ncbi:MAG: hypothetical protein LBI14_06140 [Treponema sp.]|jgi:hypothetical protein|nr:hypothetical protein [Treponema sp.]
MNKKHFFSGLLVCLLTFGIAGAAFAQQGQGFIKPTFGLQFGSMSSNGGSETGIIMNTGLDFVHSSGFTIGLNALTIAPNSGGVISGAGGGIGYTYDNGKWGIGGKFMIYPFIIEAAIGLDIIGTYWVLERLGVSGLINFYKITGSGGGIVFAVGVGVSFKY